jgi:hypothetical protein
MCKFEKNGQCIAQEIKIENVEILVDGEYQDFQRCVSFEKDLKWSVK